VTSSTLRPEHDGARPEHEIGPETDEVEDRHSIERKAGRGLRWSLFGNVLTKIASFAMGLALARLLVPADFGVYAVAFAALQFVMHVNDVGLIAATVQWRGKLAEMTPTATLLAAVFSVVIYIGFWFAAPAVAGFAHTPQAVPVLRLLTLNIVIDGITAVRSATLMREFRQSQLITANLAGLVVNAAVAIPLAVTGAGAMAFAGGQVAGAALTGVLVFVAGRVPFRLGFDRAVAARLMTFGIPLAASLGVEAILMNSDYIIVGRQLGDVQLGFYLLAFNISTWALSIISSAVRYVSVAGFSRLSEMDRETLSASVAKAVPMLFAVAVPIAVLSAVLSRPLVHFLYGHEWGPAAPVLVWLMVLTVIRMLTALAMDILMGAGATRWSLWINLGWAVTLVPALVIGTRWNGIQGTAVSHSIVGVLVALPLTILALHRIGVRVAPIAPGLLRPALGGVAAAVAALLVRHAVGAAPLAQLALAGPVGLAAYIAVTVPAAQLRRVRDKLARLAGGRGGQPDVAH
jgi:O-antigen/teichoic acid export membrane protein